MKKKKKMKKKNSVMRMYKERHGGKVTQHPDLEGGWVSHPALKQDSAST